MARGDPLVNNGKKTNKLFSVCMYILIVEACERLCYYTIYGGQVYFLRDAGCDFAALGDGEYCMSTSVASSIRSCFRLLAYVFPIFGGYLADNIFGRYNTILWFTLAYVIGVVLMAVGALPAIVDTKAGPIIYLVGGFVFTAIGTGAIKPNVVNFGAEQYDTSDPVEAEQQKSYFQYFYMVINIGSIFASVWTVTYATSKVTSEGPGSGFFVSFTIAAAAMALSLLCFVLGTGKYSAESKARAQHKPMVSIIRKHLTHSLGTSHAMKGYCSIIGLVLIPVYLVLALVGSLVGDAQPTFMQVGSASGITLFGLIAFILCVVSTLLIIYCHYDNSWIPELDTPQGSITSADVRSAFRILPTLFAINVGFNVGYNSMDIYQLQACQMNVQAPDVSWLKSFLLIPQIPGQLNGNFYSLGNNASIIIMIPLFEALIFPMLTKMRGGRPIPRKSKYILGFLLVVAANMVGVVIEVFRRKADFVPCPGDWSAADQHNYCKNGLLIAGCSSQPMRTMSAWWTFWPYFITGCGEIMVNPVLQEFAFDEVAPKLRSFMMGFTLVTMGCVPSVISALFAGFVPNDMDNGPIIWCYVINSAVSVVCLLGYFTIAIPDKLHGAALEGSSIKAETLG